MAELEEYPALPVDKEDTFAKQQLGEPHAGGSSLLRLGWNKECDETIISFPDWEADRTKRGILRKLASIYDPLGFVSPMTLVGRASTTPYYGRMISAPASNRRSTGLTSVGDMASPSTPTNLSLPPTQSNLQDLKLQATA